MPFTKDSWDWPFIIYAGTVWLNRREEELWKMTPRKLQSLLNVHFYLKKQEYGQNGKPKQEQFGYIDNIPGW